MPPPQNIPPPRKNPPTVHFVTRQDKSPLQILLQLGISKHRAEKALAATGNTCAKNAMNWLVSHVNDPRLDEIQLREYALYAVPIGGFGEKLRNFWYDARDLCSWNEGHNRLPHVTIVSFFKASAEIEPELSRSVRGVVDELNAYTDKSIELRRQHDEKFIGFYIEPPDDRLFKSIAQKYVEVVKTINLEDMSQSAIIACCPWSPIPNMMPHSSGRYIPRAKGSFDDELEHNKLNMTLAYNYDKMDSTTYSSLFDRFEHIDASTWELRLYSRDIRVACNQVFRITQKYRAQSHDELTINVDDHVVASDVAVNNGDEEGWIFGVSITTGESGYFPANHSIRVPESDCWSLHSSVHFIGSKQYQFKYNGPWEISPRSVDSLEDCARIAIDSDKKTIPWNPKIGKLVGRSNDNQKLLIMRHAERVDYTFPKWTDFCFTEIDGYSPLDLNLPITLPEREDGAYRYPWKFDPPLTNMGIHQAFLTGQMLKQQGIHIGFVYCSPAFRCVQTAQAVLKGLDANSNVKIRVEPALFEWCGNYKEVPQFLTVNELDTAGYEIDVGYVPLISQEELNRKFRGETLVTFYERSHRVSDYAVRRSSENTLLVAHAANLETNSRLLLDGQPTTLENIRELVRKVPYASLIALEKNEYFGKWSYAKPFILPLTHSRNFQFDSRTFTYLHQS